MKRQPALSDRRHVLMAMLFGSFVATGLATGCKRQASTPDEASLQSVDALRTGDQSKRTQGAFCGPGGERLDSPEEAVDRVVESMPSKLKALLSEEDRPDIRPVKDPLKFCRKALLSQAREVGIDAESRLDGLGGCWLREGKGAKAHPVIYIKKDAKTIHETLLPLLTYAFLEFALDPAREALSSRKGAGQNEARKMVARFDSALKRLTKALMKDLAERDPEGVRKRYLKILEGSEEKRRLLRYFFLAESVDSYFCSKKSHRRFQEAFPRGEKVFAKMAPVFGAPWHRQAKRQELLLTPKY